MIGGFKRTGGKNDYDRGGFQNDRFPDPGHVILALAHLTSIEGGEYAKVEAEKKWQECLEDPAWPRNHNGPKGYLQLALPNAETVLKHSQNIQHKKGATFTGKMHKDIICHFVVLSVSECT